MLPAGKKRSRTAAFTLVELVLTALIVAILVGVSMPLFSRQFSDLELRNSCYNIAKLTSLAQQKAIAEGRFYKINFDFEEAKYWLTAGEDLEEFERLGTKYGRTYRLPSQSELRGKKSSFIFYPNGNSEKMEIIIVGRTAIYSLKSKGRLGHIKIEKIKNR